MVMGVSHCERCFFWDRVSQIISMRLDNMRSHFRCKIMLGLHRYPMCSEHSSQNCTDNSSVPLSANDTSRDEAIVVSNILFRLRFKEGTFPKVRT